MSVLLRISETTKFFPTLIVFREWASTHRQFYPHEKTQQRETLTYDSDSPAKIRTEDLQSPSEHGKLVIQSCTRTWKYDARLESGLLVTQTRETEKVAVMISIMQYLQLLCLAFSRAGPTYHSGAWQWHRVSQDSHHVGIQAPDPRHAVWWMERHLLDWIPCDRINLRHWWLVWGALFPL
jgi:hypothetical protein